LPAWRGDWGAIRTCPRNSGQERVGFNKCI
jgi:hypothetical protein